MFKSQKLLSRLCERLELPGQAAVGEPQVLLSGDRQLTVEGHRGIRRYGPDRIEVRTARSCVCVDGQGLQITLLNPGCMVIRGKLRSVTLEAAPCAG